MSIEDNTELDPRIQIELEKLNSTTLDINRLEVEYDEANLTFRMLLNESTRRLKGLSKKLGNCIEKARLYYNAVAVAKKAQQECQQAAILYRKANEIYAAAKETVTLAEQRFISNQHEWEFDLTWQEMLNHATIKVMEAENKRTETGREHQRCASVFSTAEQNVKMLLDKHQKAILKAQPYFDENSLCQDQLNVQKERIEQLRKTLLQTKQNYMDTLKALEQISNEIHTKHEHRRIDSGTSSIVPDGPREPGVGQDDLDYNLDDLVAEAAMDEERPQDGGGEGQSMETIWEPETTTLHGLQTNKNSKG